jgi:hypothetical protein
VPDARARALKNNVLPFPALTYAAPDRRPSKRCGLVGLVILIIAAGLICLTGWFLITL